VGGDGFTPVHVTTDPVESELLADVLRERAIDARVVQVNAALLGAGQQVFQTRIEVPVAEEARARELIEELGRPDQAEAFSEPPEPGPDEDERAERRRQERLTAGIAFILPGAGHFRARRPTTTLVLMAGILTCLLLLARTVSPFAQNMLFVTVFAVLACDALGARRINRDLAESTPRQLGRGVALLGIASLTGAAIGGAAVLLPSLLQRTGSGIAVACSADDLILSNRSAERMITIDRVRVKIGSGTYGASIRGDDFRELPPGSQARLELDVPDFVRRYCRGGSWRQPDDCTVIARVLSKNPAEPHAALLQKRAWCAPDWSTGGRAAATLIDPEDLDERLEAIFEAPND
jgi:hypothetical protein